MTLKFGTDGVRGDAESELTSEFVRALGRSAARVLTGDRWYIARDTRESGERIEADLAAGLRDEGRLVDLIELAPTPAVAFLSEADDLPGAMVSASHNPWSDNGIKFFAPGGRKLSDDTEGELESELAGIRASGEQAPAVPAGALAPTAPVALLARYRAHLVESLEGRRLDGLRVILDCANGAASDLAAAVFEGLGAAVHVMHADPDGRNINEGCGSTDPRSLQTAIVEGSADIGLAFDGDADRVLAVDESGVLVDGDEIIGMCAIDRRDRHVLPDNTVVATVMANLGFRRGMTATGIEIVETPVGDRHVLEALDEGGFTLGGEQSGHVIFRDLATTGDGILTGLQVCDLLMRTGRFLSDLAATSMSRYPQVLRNVEVAERHADIAELLSAEIASAEADLGGEGRILVRSSGTEPLVRVMVEASTAELADSVAERLSVAVSEQYA